VSLRRIARGSQAVEFILIVVIALAVAFGLQAFVVKPYRIPSGSMKPTLAIGQRVLVDRIGNDFFAPSVGDIVVFHPPVGAPGQICGNTDEKPGQACDRPTTGESTENYIKRVVAGPGDTAASTSTASASPRSTPASVAAPRPTRIATTRRRSRFRPVTTS
jgi:signal peptidase I